MKWILRRQVKCVNEFFFVSSLYTNFIFSHRVFYSHYPIPIVYFYHAILPPILITPFAAYCRQFLPRLLPPSITPIAAYCRQFPSHLLPPISTTSIATYCRQFPS